MPKCAPPTKTQWLKCNAMSVAALLGETEQMQREI